jgi:hypothetical protein
MSIRKAEHYIVGSQKHRFPKSPAGFDFSARAAKMRVRASLVCQSAKHALTAAHRTKKDVHRRFETRSTCHMLARLRQAPGPATLPKTNLAVQGLAGGTRVPSLLQRCLCFPLGRSRSREKRRKSGRQTTKIPLLREESASVVQ